MDFRIVIACFINSIGRSAPNEFQHLIIHSMQGSLWAIYAFVGYLFILIWWIQFFYDLSKTNSKFGGTFYEH